VFRKFFDPPLSRERVEAAGDSRGRLLLPGGDQAARGAWTAQFLQEQPGRFSPDREAWEGGEEALFEGQRFQQGARTYSWVELWPDLLAGNEEDQGEPVWVYGPLSRIRALPLHETNILEADPFPGKTGWTEFGVEAEILWAAPYGRPWFDGKVLDRTGTWLRDMETQIRWAAALGWVAAHRDAPPHNPVSAAARVIWLTSSYVWERGSPGE
jgi:hypothetical protein